jgi:hypothetical protein
LTAEKPFLVRPRAVYLKMKEEVSMQIHSWHPVVFSLLIVGGLAFPTLAEEVSIPAAAAVSAPKAASPRRWNRQGFPRNGNGFERRLRGLGLSPEQMDAVRGLLAQQREKFQALRQEMEPKYAAIQEQTDGKIRALLNSEQQQKFDTLVAQMKAERASRRSRGYPSR